MSKIEQEWIGPDSIKSVGIDGISVQDDFYDKPPAQIYGEPINIKVNDDADD